MQSQLINLIPNPNSTTPAPRSADRSVAGMFEEMLQQGTSPIIEKPKQNQQPVEEQKPQQVTEEQPDENAAVIPANLLSAMELLNASLQEQVLAVVDEIVSILEGYQQDNLNKDIVPLLRQLAEELTALDQAALAEEANQLAEEVQARMPDNRDTAEDPQLAKLAAFLEKVRGDLSPSENVNDTPELALENNLHIAKTESKQETQAQTQQQTEEPVQFVAPDFQNRVEISEIRNQFDQQLQQLQTPVAKENLFETMVERINVPFEENPHMEIQLKPDGLGKVTIDLVLTENGLTAKILTSDEGVRNLLAAQVTRLSEALTDKGIKVENIDVAYAPLADRNFDRPQQQEQSQRQTRSGQPLSIDALTPDGISYEPYYELSPEETSLGLSSVEFHA